MLSVVVDASIGLVFGRAGDLPFGFLLLLSRSYESRLEMQGLVASVRSSETNERRGWRGSSAANNYLILNLSEREYDESKFGGRVARLGWPDHHAPTLKHLNTVVRRMESYLSESKDHVVVVHWYVPVRAEKLCGRGRSNRSDENFVVR